MRTNYIVIHNKFIKNDLSSLRIYYDYFSPGVELPYGLRFRILR